MKFILFGKNNFLKNNTNTHPSNMWNRVLNALDNDSKNCEKKYFRAMRENARVFYLKNKN